MTGQGSTRTAQKEKKCPYYNNYFFHVGITANITTEMNFSTEDTVQQTS